MTAERDKTELFGEERLSEFVKDNLDRVRKIEALTGEEYTAAKKQFLLDFRDYGLKKMMIGLIDEIVAETYPEEEDDDN